MANQCESYKFHNAAFEKRLDNLQNEQMFHIKELVLRMSFMWQECQMYRQDTLNEISGETFSFALLDTWLIIISRLRLRHSYASCKKFYFNYKP
jgi:hypothetical protein